MEISIADVKRDALNFDVVLYADLSRSNLGRRRLITILKLVPQSRYNNGLDYPRQYEPFPTWFAYNYSRKKAAILHSLDLISLPCLTSPL